MLRAVASVAAVSAINHANMKSSHIDRALCLWHRRDTGLRTGA
jgi:hypothetical protein